MAEQRDIKYINREFSDFRTQLVEYAKQYFPDSYNDFSATAPGMMFIEMASYVGDVLSFYQDTQLQETFLQHAQNPQNLYTMAYMMGYRPKVTTASEVELEVTQEVDPITGGDTPDFDQALFISGGAVVGATDSNDTKFIIDSSVDFKFSSSYDPTEVTITTIDSGTNLPSVFQLKKKVKAYSGTVNTQTEAIGSAQKFKTIEIEDANIIRVLDITDSDGNLYYEVPFLGQDTIFLEKNNQSSYNELVKSTVQLTKVPRRFVTRFTSTGTLQIQFGAGIISADDEAFLPDPTLLTKFGSQDAVNAIDIAYDPSNVLFSRTYGLAPSNTTLTIRYITGGGVGSNVPSNTVTTKTSLGTITATDTSKESTLAFNNPKAATGGKDGDTVEELRQNALRSFAEQGRTVTVDDYTVRALAMPSQFGAIAKAYVTRELLANSDRSVLDKNPLALSLYVLAYDVDGKLTTASNTLKENLRKYLSQYMMITDALDIKDAFVVNLEVKYEVLTLPNYASREVLTRCTQVLKDYFKTTKRNINQPINLSELYTALDKVKGVQTVKDIKIKNLAGGNYSGYAYDTEGATKDNIVYPSYDPCIFEVKFPDLDIKGRVTAI
jgi:hypothetical protein|tara:strand:+ start:1487 stop:3310 length:1824 start_codon:yes stop_codon:yes gene_type:complete